MSTNRRNFLKLSALAGGSIGLGLIPGASDLLAAGQKADGVVKRLRILILGGTGFTGPFQVRYALSRGHRVTVFNRGSPRKTSQVKGRNYCGARNRSVGSLARSKEIVWV